jgi:hypothetical protein
VANPVWDGAVTYLTWVTLSTNSFNVPASTLAVTIITPDFGTDTTCVVQGLDPIDKTTWRSLYTYDPGDGTMTLLTLDENKYHVIPGAALGIGTFRLTNANTQVGLQATVIIARIN